MTGTGRRRKPSSEDEEPRSAEESGGLGAEGAAGSSGTTWSTYAPPPEPDYTYDWRRDGSASGTAYPDLPPPLPPLPPPGGGTGYGSQAPGPGSRSGYDSGYDSGPGGSGSSGSYGISGTPVGGLDPSQGYPSQPPSGYGSVPPASSPSNPSVPPASPYASPLPSYLQPPPPEQPDYPQAPPSRPAQSSAYVPPPAAQGFYAPKTFEQPPPYLPDEPSTGEYQPAGYQPSRYTPPPTDSQATRRPPAPSPSAQSGADGFDVDGLFDADALFDPDPAERPDPIAQSSASLSATSTSPSVSASDFAADFASAAGSAAAGAKTEADPAAERKPTKISSSKADFAFVEEETDQKDIAGWLTFVETRAESRAERARRMRNRLIAGGAALALAAGGTLAYLWASGSPLLGAAPAASRDVILLQIADNTSGDAVADAILAADRPAAGASGATAGHGAAVLIPSQMSVTGIGSGTQAFGGDMTADPAVPPAGVTAVSDSLGVQVNAVWSMDETTFAALVDLFGGVTVTSNASVPAVTGSAKPAPKPTSTGSAKSSSGSATPSASASASAPAGSGSGSAAVPQVTSAAIPQGSVKLNGAQAITYSLYQAPGEPIGAQVDRFGQVLGALMTELPTTGDLVNSYLNQLGVVPDPSLPQDKLASILAEMAAEQQANQFTVKALPLQDNATDQLDFNAAGPIISSLLGGTVQSGLTSGGTARVLVEDGTGTTSDQDTLIQSAAQAKLVSAGYSYVGSTSVRKQSKSVIQIPTGSDQSAANEVAQTLGLPASDVQVVSGMSEISDITVVLGTDWIQTGESGT